MGKVYTGISLLLIVSFIYYQNKSADKAQLASLESQQRTIEAYEDYVKKLEAYNKKVQQHHQAQMQEYAKKLEEYYARKLKLALKAKEKRTPASIPPLVAAPTPEPYIPPPMEEPRSDRDFEMDVQFPEPGAPLDYLPRVPK